ncbi:MAG: hypothetical protein U5Q03_14910 [Bacteroidota bacterium]|nr:hypothetical protein [Bacteroidota bacterium]
MDFHEDGFDLTTAEYLALSSSIYDKADAIWCALAHAASDGICSMSRTSMIVST